MKNRKTYFRKDIGRLEIEGGWFPGESWAIEAHAGFSPSDRRLCLVYLQVAKLCFSITVDTGRRVSLEDAADWGEKFDAAAHSGPMPAANGLPSQLDDYIDWAKVPDWVIWISLNGDDGTLAYFGNVQPVIVGDWQYFEPSKYGVADWKTGDNSVIIGPLPPWRESLRRRPGSEAAE